MHPLVAEFFSLWDRNTYGLCQLAKSAKIAPSTIAEWRRVKNPRLLHMNAALKVLGYKLTITKVENAETL